MKNYRLILSTAVLFCAAIPTVLFAAEVVFLQGKVQVQSQSDTAWREAEKGMPVIVGDLIRTARNSIAEVALDSEKKNTVRIEEKSVVVLSSSTAGSLDRLNLAKGKVYANLEGLRSGLSFEVTTPSAVAGVRGSGYSVYVEKDADEVVAYKHTVFIKAFDADKKEISETMLPEGYKTIIERFSEPGLFSQISSGEYKRFDRIVDGLTSRVEGRDVREEEAGDTQEPAPFHGQVGQIEEQQDVIDEIIDTKSRQEDNNSDSTIEQFRGNEDIGLSEQQPEQPEEPEQPEPEPEY